ncbi:MAG: aspartate dehydrogenase domain-containing protein [Candidatus Bathyarchaeia archaeon]
MKTVGLIGCGAIGTVLAEAIGRKLVVCDELVLFDFDQAKAEHLKSSLAFPTTIVSSLDDLLKCKPAVIVEAASQQAVKAYVPRIVAEGIDVIVMSSGALLELDVCMSKVHVPSGAIGGIDAITSAALAGEVAVTLTTTKNPKALETQDKTPKVIYEGDAQEAARLFPREMNVAATLALAVKPAKVKVTVIADPNVKRNTHKIVVKWKFGEMLLQFSNDPHPDNPRTSALAAWSAIKLLQTLLLKQ